MPGVLTICPFCGCGCALYLRAEGGTLVGVAPSVAHPVGQGRLCAKGWHAHELPLSSKRLLHPLIRHGGKLSPTAWSNALEAAAKGLGGIRQRHGSQALGALGSASATNEANYLLMRLARQAFGSNSVDLPSRAALPDLTSSATLSDLDTCDLLLLIGADSGDEHPAVTARIVRARRRGAKLVGISTRRNRMARISDLCLMPAPGRLTELVAGLLAAAHADEAASGLSPEQAAAATGVSVEQIQQAGAAIAAASRPVCVIGRAALCEPGSEDLLSLLSRLIVARSALGDGASAARHRWLTLGGRSNARGALEMGVHPGLLTGYQPLIDPVATGRFEAAWGVSLPTERGLALHDMPGTIRGLLVLGESSLASSLEPGLMERLLEGVEFLVVQDSVPSPLAERADVVLPAAVALEEDGTFTNLEGRVQRLRQALPPPADARPGWQIVSELARHMGIHFRYDGPAKIMDEIADLTPLYEGARYAQLDQLGGSMLARETAACATERVASLQTEPRAADAEYPLLLQIDFAASSWEGDCQLAACATLTREFSIELRDFPAGCVLLSPADAKALGFRPAARVKVVGKAGEFASVVQVSDEAPQGVVLLPFRDRAKAAQLLPEGRGAVEIRIEGVQ